MKIKKEKLSEFDLSKLRKYITKGILTGAVALSVAGGIGHSKADNLSDFKNGNLEVNLVDNKNGNIFGTGLYHVKLNKDLTDPVKVDFDNLTIYIKDISVLKNQEDFHNLISQQKSDDGHYLTSADSDSTNKMFKGAFNDWQKQNGQSSPSNLIQKLHNNTLNVNMGMSADGLQSSTVKVDSNLDVPIKIESETGDILIKDESILQDPAAFKNALIKLRGIGAIVNFDAPVNEIIKLAESKIFQDTYSKHKKLILEYLKKKKV